MSSFMPIFPPASSRGQFYGYRNPGMKVDWTHLNYHPAHLKYLTDTCDFTTWLLLAALLQGTLLLLRPTPIALLPAALILLYRTLRTLLQATGHLPNPLMAGIHPRVSAQYPSSTGQYPRNPSSDEICVALIGARSNHPFSAFNKESKAVGDAFQAMAGELEGKAEELGFLGMTTWFGSERYASNDTLTICYFKNSDYLHKFSNSPVHREPWDAYYRDIVKTGKNTQSIWHEFYMCRAGHWENLYVNSHPVALGTTSSLAILEEDGKKMEKWMSPLVDARRKKLRTGLGAQATHEEHMYGHLYD